MLISNQISLTKVKVIYQTKIFELIPVFIEVIKAYPFILTKHNLLREIYILC